MIKDVPVTAIVAGRGGSKGLQGKNLADLGGRPLVAWSVAAAAESRYVDHIAVSSDDPDILAAAGGAGNVVQIERPADLATDTASIHDAIIHALDVIDCFAGFVVLLQATSPLRTAGDIDACIAAAAEAHAPAVTVAPAAKPPQWMYRLGENRSLSPFTQAEGGRRQEFETLYLLNGAVYVAETDWYRRNRTFIGDDTVGIVMPVERSVDIDSAFDLAVARALIHQTEEQTGCLMS